MNLLLDTHVALWAITDHPALGREARSLILATSNSIHVSAASIWEIAIKHALRKKSMPLSAGQAVSWFAKAGYSLLPVTAEHAVQIEKLPALHADPFDRILVAQAITAPMRLITHDGMVARYSDTVILI